MFGVVFFFFEALLLSLCLCSREIWNHHKIGKFASVTALQLISIAKKIWLYQKLQTELGYWKIYKKETFIAYKTCLLANFGTKN